MNNGSRYKASQLAAVLENQGRKQRWLALQLGIHESIVSAWISGKRTLGEDRAKQVADTLGLPLFLLFDVTNGTETVAETREVA